MDQNFLYVMLTIIVAVIITLVGVRFLLRNLSPNQNQNDIEKQLGVLRQEKTNIEKELAVQETKASRVNELEQTLSEKSTLVESLKEAKATAEASLLEKIAIISQLRAELNGIETTLTETQKNAADLASRNAVLQETLEQERKQSNEKLNLLETAKGSMTKEFQILADNAMKTHGENFTKKNQEQIDAILRPLKDQLISFQQGLQQANTESTKERTTLTEQIRALSQASSIMTSETTNLTKALRGDTQTQGAWGEMILSSILEKSGLREGEEYVVQETHTTEEGGRLRSDILVKLPGGQKIVIDSKVSLISFDNFVNAENDEDSSTHLGLHLASMRSHIKGLGNKEYQWAAGSNLDYVIMFVPIEGALAAAQKRAPELATYAIENNVSIATPTTLMTVLRTVASIWQVERRNRNAELIAARAGKIYDKLFGFVEDMNGLGNRLTQAQTAYGEAMSKLSSGRGNLIGQVEQLKGLGARTNKSLPDNLLDEPEIDETQDPDVVAAAE